MSMDSVPPPRARASTIRDVARHANVGVGTVSRVLNDSPLVSEDTRDRVRTAIDALGYRRSSAARSLSLGRSEAVGVVAPFLTSESVIERLRGVVMRLAERGYDLVLFDVETPKQRSDAFRDFANHDRVDGLLVLSLPLTDDEVERMRRDDLPIVLVDARRADLPHVAIDNARGGQLATEHLLEKGHRRIGFVGDLRDRRFGFTSSEDRRKGYRRALRRAGIAPDPALEHRAPHGRREARALAQTLLAAGDRPSAVFAASDTQAIGVLEAARALGLRVPDDVAVIGFDDIEMADILGLTTVRQPLFETGVRGADLLLAEMDGADLGGVAELEPLVVVQRATT
jgi:LacI family transcriptional regulator/LacI family repressor for deo operon, udp, cdd, tsx, nupC, and nupG